MILGILLTDERKTTLNKQSATISHLAERNLNCKMKKIGGRRVDVTIIKIFEKDSKQRDYTYFPIYLGLSGLHSGELLQTQYSGFY